MNLAQIEEARALASPVSVAPAAANDVTPMFVVQYVPKLGTGGAAATIALVQDGAMTFLVDGSAPTGLDAIGTAGVIDTSAAANDTVGELLAVINATSAWRAYAVGAMFWDNCAGLLAKGAATAFGDNGLTFFWDTSEAFLTDSVTAIGTREGTAFAVSAEKFVNNGIGGHVKDSVGQAENSLLSLVAELQTTGAGLCSFFASKDGAAETRLWQTTLTDATELVLGGTNPGEIFITAPRGERLIVRLTALTSVEAIDTLEASGKSAVLSGSYMVTEKNF